MEPVIIVGAGPAGLSTAACLKRLGIEFTLLDRTGRAGGSFGLMQKSMKLLSPRRYVNLPHFPYPGPEEYPSMPSYADYLEKYAARFGLTLEQEEGSEVQRVSDGFELYRVSEPPRRCRCLVVATGLFGHPVWPEIHGLAVQMGEGEKPIVIHARDWPGP